MSNKRREGFVLGSAIFPILAVGTYLFTNHLIGWILIVVLRLDPSSREFAMLGFVGVPIILILTIALPTYATYVLLKRHSYS